MTDPTPSRRAGLRDEIAAALEAADYSGNMRRGDLADSVMPVLYREWPWLRAEAEDAEQQLTEARQWARHGYEIGQRHCSWTDHGVAPDWLTDGWPPHFGSCEHLQRAAEYDTELTRLRQGLANILTDMRATSSARQWIAALDKLIPATEPHGDGPSVAEAAADDRRWDLQREGE